MAQDAREDLIPYATLLRYPTWYGSTPDERTLPLEPSAYAIEKGDGDRWRVTVRHTGEVLYEGVGPVEVMAS